MEKPFKILMVDHHVTQKSLPSPTKKVPCRSQTVYQDAFQAFHVLSMISIEVWGVQRG